ncbi:MAG: hypothetical protein PHW74_06710 [Desulfobacca sp.]|nr:hypothetical protein [Desulfobacca sp.]
MRHDDILVLNDGSPLLPLIGGLLEARGYDIFLTDEPEEALEIGFSHPLGLIIAKLDGDQIDRLAVLSMIKNLNPAAKLVVLSDDTGFPAEAYEMEVDDYIHPPCRSAEIWQRIARMARAVPVGAQAESKSPAAPARGRLFPINLLVFSKLGLMLHDLQVSLTGIANRLQVLKYQAEEHYGDELKATVDSTLTEIVKMIRMTRKFSNNFSGQWPGLTPSLYDLDKDRLILKESTGNPGDLVSKQIH